MNDWVPARESRLPGSRLERMFQHGIDERDVRRVLETIKSRPPYPGMGVGFQEEAARAGVQVDIREYMAA